MKPSMVPTQLSIQKLLIEDGLLTMTPCVVFRPYAGLLIEQCLLTKQDGCVMVRVPEAAWVRYVPSIIFLSQGFRRRVHGRLCSNYHT